MKKIIVMSLGGSLIVPEKIEPKWLKYFVKIILKHRSKNKFVIVCGGGFVAREYITILSADGKNQKEQSLAGIEATRMNAKVMIQLFGTASNKKVPYSMKEIAQLLKKDDIVLCGGLRYAPNQTSDGTAARLAKYLNSEFINFTDIDGLYSSNPKIDQNAVFIPRESWKLFEERANKISYHPGQHFVLDQNAASIIRKNKIKTYIIGKNLKNIDKLLSRKKFRGTVIAG